MKAHINHKCEYDANVSVGARTLARTLMLALVRGYVCILLMHEFVRMHSRVCKQLGGSRLRARVHVISATYLRT